MFCVKVRPMLPKEKVGGDEMCLKIIPTTKQLILGKDRGFTFDEVLSPKTSQVRYNNLTKTHIEKFISSDKYMNRSDNNTFSTIILF